MKHDRKFKTYYSFYSDQDFNHTIWRKLWSQRYKSKFCAALADYAWKRYIFQNEQANSVLLWQCNTGNDVTVN